VACRLLLVFVDAQAPNGVLAPVRMQERRAENPHPDRLSEPAKSVRVGSLEAGEAVEEPLHAGRREEYEDARRFHGDIHKTVRRAPRDEHE
jgi:hypothetical protein